MDENMSRSYAPEKRYSEFRSVGRFAEESFPASQN
jgi:hypothetical protein